MTTKLGERAAFPSCNENGDGPRGMSTRTWLAGMALQGQLAGGADKDRTKEELGKWSVLFADALLAELEKRCD